MPTRPTLIVSVQRALHLVDAVGAATAPPTAKQLARRTGLAPGTAYHLLRTLVHEEYLVREPDGGYRLGTRMQPAGAVPAAASPGPRTVPPGVRLRPLLVELHQRLRAAVYLSAVDDGEVRIIEVIDSPGAPRVDLWVAAHDAAHATALGKCLLAQLEAPSMTEYLLGHRLPALTARTTTDPTSLCRQLARPRPRRWSTDLEEYAAGTACVAVPLLAPTVVGCLAVSVPTTHVSRLAPARHVLGAGAARASRALALAD
ncbi:MAG: IclR family transcriptional regulator [Actinomycetes bacterium]